MSAAGEAKARSAQRRAIKRGRHAVGRESKCAKEAEA
jgi:hypothetical protein